jgi:hypothetical protein
MATRNPQVEKKLVGLADLVIEAAAKKKDPAISIPVRALSNVTFNEKRGIIEMGKNKQQRTFFNVAMAKKFMQTMLVADALNELQKSDLTTSLREIYYRTKHTMGDSHENTFDDQAESDPVIEDLEVSLAALREEFHVRAENAGTIIGPVVFEDDGDKVDCAKLGKGGYSVPSIVEDEYLKIKKCTADFVLLIEKGTQWNRLAEDKFWKKYNCILLTGNGAPPARGEEAPGLRARRQRPLGVLHLLRGQAGLHQPGLREPAHGHPGGEVHRPVLLRPGVLRPAPQRRHQAQRQGRLPRQGAAELPVVPEEGVADRDQEDDLLRPQVRARRPRQQGLPVPDQDLPAQEAQGEGLARLIPG